MEKPLDGKSEKLCGCSLWGAGFEEGGVTHLESDTWPLCQKADQSQKTAYSFVLGATEILSAALSCYSQSHLGFSLALKTTDTCGFQHFPHGKGDTCNDLSFFLILAHFCWPLDFLGVIPKVKTFVRHKYTHT